jgi:hypothetical protein
MNNENIIALAEFVGLMVIQPLSDDAGECYYQASPEDVLTFEPHTSADDCDAVTRKLNELGWKVNVNQESGGHCVKVWRFKNPDTRELVWEGDDYKHGVCELALKIINE